MLVAVRHWKARLQSYRVKLVIQSDSLVALALTQRMASSTPTLNYLGAELSLAIEEAGIERLEPVHIPGSANVAPDFLSRPSKWATVSMPTELHGVNIETPEVRVEDFYTPVLPRTTKYYSSTTPYYKRTTKYYSVLQSTTPVLLQYYSSTTPYYKRTTPVLLRTTKYYSSTTPYYKRTTKYYSVLQSTTPVLLQYYSVLQTYYSSTPYYKVLLQYYSLLQSTTLYYKVLRQYSSALQSTSPALLPTIQYYNRARTSARNTRSSASSTSASTSSTSTSTSSTSTTSASKMPILPQFRAIGTHDLTKGLHSAPQNRNFTTVSCDRHARSYERVALSTAKSQFYYSFVRSTRSILRKGCQNRNFTTVSCNRHARSHERVHPAQTKSQFYHSFARSTRTILRKGSSGTNGIAILLQFRAIDTHDLTRGLHFRKHFPDHGGPPPLIT